MKLFDNISRNYKGYRGYTEPAYEYLNRSARSSSEKIRNLLEDWFFSYPTDAQNELRSRFRSSDDIHHHSAFFELYLYSLLSRLEFEIEVHPKIPGQTTHPEFLASRNNTPCFFLEATLASGPIEEKAADKREKAVYETLDKMNSPNFFIGIEVHGSPDTPPPGRKWRSYLSDWLSKLDPDEIGEKLKGGDLHDLPGVTLNHDKWNVTFRAIPKSSKTRGKKGIRPIGLRFSGFWKCNEDEWIRKAIKEKTTKYGNPNLPYIIAINVISDYGKDDYMIMDVLFGQEGFTLNHKLIRDFNGIFRGPHGPQNTRVSGVIICENLSSGRITKTNPKLWHNPWSSFPINQDLWPLPQYVPNLEKTRIELKPGIKVAELFDLPVNWPIQNSRADL